MDNNPTKPLGSFIISPEEKAEWLEFIGNDYYEVPEIKKNTVDPKQTLNPTLVIKGEGNALAKVCLIVPHLDMEMPQKEKLNGLVKFIKSQFGQEVFILSLRDSLAHGLQDVLDQVPATFFVSLGEQVQEAPLEQHLSQNIAGRKVLHTYSLEDFVAEPVKSKQTAQAITNFLK